MFDDTKIDAFIKQVIESLPDELTQLKQDLEKNIRAAISSSFSKMDLVTREEFDVQAELLARTRALLEEMEQKVEQLEKALSEKKQSK